MTVTVADIVHDLRRILYAPEPQRAGDEAADLLERFDAEIATAARVAHAASLFQGGAGDRDTTVGFLTMLDGLRRDSDELERLDALRPPCPNVGRVGGGLHQLHDGIDEVWYPCPENGYDCDGRMSWERMAAIVGRVIDIATQPQSPGTETTLTDWLMCKDVRP